ncbi:putative bifunctional diguanylate cyclase/phosphodiesterase [Rhabdothermincola sp.]|uniref:putative bifunctional diguanylate cyclase/phosphodiesterase n=1 Tax=Rhabdothermincola sp. TaxID=2820405 RepID=UPI002FE3C721
MNHPAQPAGEAERGGKFRRLLRSSAAPVDGPSESDQAIDPITGVPTRAALVPALRRAVDESKSESTVAVLAFVEAGALRDVNDTLGPDVGDELLRLAGERLRVIDVPGLAVVRYEGAVFGVVIPKVPNVAGAETIARFLIEHLSEPFTIGGTSVRIGPIVGAAVSTDNYDELDDMVRDAYGALVEARGEGNAAFVIHDETKRARFSTRIDDRRLQDAFEHGEFELFYQPIVRLDSDELVGVEALIRWMQPGTTSLGMLFPHDFLPLLEKSGRIVEVGRWVLNQACWQLAAWQALSPDVPKLFVSCNVGPHELADHGLIDAVTSAITANGVQPWQLCLDITEAALRHNRFQRDTVWAGLRALSNQGVKLGLDDFGTGEASLSVLREMKLDLLRVDRLFVSGLGIAREDHVIVRHIASLAHDLGCLAVAEGVETDEQAGALRELGVDLAQGFRYGKPQTAQEIAKRLAPDAARGTDRWDPSNVLPG